MSDSRRGDYYECIKNNTLSFYNLINFTTSYGVENLRNLITIKTV